MRKISRVIIAVLTVVVSLSFLQYSQAAEKKNDKKDKKEAAEKTKAPPLPDRETLVEFKGKFLKHEEGKWGVMMGEKDKLFGRTFWGMDITQKEVGSSIILSGTPEELVDQEVMVRGYFDFADKDEGINLKCESVLRAAIMLNKDYLANKAKSDELLAQAKPSKVDKKLDKKAAKKDAKKKEK